MSAILLLIVGLLYPLMTITIWTLGPCGRARLDAQAWLAEKANHDAAVKAARPLIRRHSPTCDGDMWLPDAVKCDHRESTGRPQATHEPTDTPTSTTNHDGGNVA
jgi:hypothetical protein